MSDMSLAVAVAEAGKWGNLIRALSKLAETADYLNVQASLESERKARLDELARKAADAEQILNAALSRVAQARQESQDILSEAQVKADALVTIAESKVAEAANTAATRKAEAVAAIKERDLAYAAREKALKEEAAALGRIEQAKAQARAAIG